MHWLLLIGLVFAQTQTGPQRTITRAPTSSDKPSPSAALPGGETTPASVTRGRTTTVRVTGVDAAALRSVQFNPPGGLQVVDARDALPLPDGRRAATLTLAVDPTAAPGDRTLTIADPSAVNIAMTESSDPKVREMQQQAVALIRQQEGKREVGTIHVNTHDVQITDVRVSAPAPGREGRPVVFTVVDAAGDLAAAPAGGPLAVPSQPTTIKLEDQPMETELTCAGSKEAWGAIVEGPTRVDRKDATTMLVTGELILLDEVKGACELRARIRDGEGNLSDWYVAKIDLR